MEESEGRNRFCLGTGIGCFAVTLVLFGLAWKIRDFVSGTVTTEPEKIAAIVGSLVPIDPPSGWLWSSAASVDNAKIAWLTAEDSGPDDPLVIAYSYPADGGRGKDRLWLEGFEISRRRDDRGRMVGEVPFTLGGEGVSAIETLFDDEFRDYTLILPRGDDTVFLVFYGPTSQVDPAWVQTLLNRAP